MMMLFVMFPCTTFKHTITAIALITLQDYILCKYIKRTIVNQQVREVSYCRLREIMRLFPSSLAKENSYTILVLYRQTFSSISPATVDLFFFPCKSKSL